MNNYIKLHLLLSLITANSVQAAHRTYRDPISGQEVQVGTEYSAPEIPVTPETETETTSTTPESTPAANVNVEAPAPQVLPSSDFCPLVEPEEPSPYIEIETLLDTVLNPTISEANTKKHALLLIKDAVAFGASFLGLWLSKHYLPNNNPQVTNVVSIIIGLASLKATRAAMTLFDKAYMIDPRDTAVATEIMRCMSSGKTVVSRESSVQNLLDTLLLPAKSSELATLSNQAKIELSRRIRAVVYAYKGLATRSKSRARRF